MARTDGDYRLQAIWRERVLTLLDFATFLAIDFQMPDRPWRTGSQTRDGVNVSQAFKSPVSRPRLNQRTRCSELPWVKLSGAT